MGKSRISNNIRKLRFFHDEMTQQQLAEKVGVTRQTIIAMEQEKYSPSLELAFRIANIFGVPLEEVFSYDFEDETNQYSNKEHIK
jgi:putative transcriptional regulator